MIRLIDLCKRLYRFFVQKTKGKKHIVNLHGFTMFIPEDMYWCFASGDYYEQNVIHFLDKIIKIYKTPVVFDIGANYGYYSLKHAPSCKQIISFEPVSETYKILAKNIKKNKLTNITAFNFGLSNEKATQKINLYSSSGNNSLFERKIPTNHSLKKIGEETIMLDTIDNLISQHKIWPPDVIKIDVEGAELNVLLGAKETIIKYRPTILMEYSEATANDAGYAKEILLKTLGLSDYNIYGILEDVNNLNLIPTQKFETEKIDNIIFIPNERDIFNDHR